MRSSCARPRSTHETDAYVTATSIRLRRDARDWTERLRAYRVLLDDVPAGTIRRGGTVQLDVAPGHHHVQVTIDWGRSPVLELELADGEEVELRCFTDATPLTALWRATVGRRRYLGLEREPTVGVTPSGAAPPRAR